MTEKIRNFIKQLEIQEAEYYEKKAEEERLKRIAEEKQQEEDRLKRIAEEKQAEEERLAAIKEDKRMEDEQFLRKKEQLQQLIQQKKEEVESGGSQDKNLDAFAGFVEEVSFLKKAKNKIEDLMEKQDKIEDNLLDRIDDGYDKIPKRDQEEIYNKFSDLVQKEHNKAEEKSKNLEIEFPDDLKPVAYFQKKVDIEASSFKKIIQLREKEEKAIDEKIKEKPDYRLHKDQYEKERSEWQKEHVESVKDCRQEKQQIKKDIDSNLMKPSEIAAELANEGDDYGGGDE